MYARLNILSKPMQVYNVDECGVNVTLHEGWVVSELGRRNVHRVTASEKGRTIQSLCAALHQGMQFLR